jgi:hypothetical protein
MVMGIHSVELKAVQMVISAILGMQGGNRRRFQVEEKEGKVLTYRLQYSDEEKYWPNCG